MEKRGALARVNIAVLLFGMAGLFARRIDLPALAITFGRVAFSSAALGLYLLLSGRPFAVKSRSDAARLICAGAVLTLHWWSFLASVQLASVAVGTITFSSFPLFVTIFEAAMRRRAPTAREVIPALMILAGVAVTMPKLSPENRALWGVLAGMGSAVSYAVLTLMNQSLSGRYGAISTAFWEQLAAAALLLVPALRLGVRPDASDIALTALLGVVMTAVAHTLFIGALRHVPARVAGVCSAMETVYGILLAWLLLGEAASARELLGAAVIVGTVIWTQLRETKEPAREDAGFR